MPGAHPDLQEPIPASAPPSPQPFTGLVFSRTLIVLLSSYLFFPPVYTRQVQGLVVSGSRLFAWRLASLEAVGPVQTRGAQGLDLGLARGFLQMKFWLEARLQALNPGPVPTRRMQGLDLGLAQGL